MTSIKKINPVFTGTFFLTFTGLLCKIIGFYYRIFLSKEIGATNLGLYQLIFPLFTIGYAMTTTGLSTALTRYIANHPSKILLKKTLFTVLLLTVILGCLLVEFRVPISKYLLREQTCAPLFFLLAASLPFASLHGCIHSYYFGLQKSLIPSISSVVEQAVRISAFYVYVQICKEQDIAPSATGAMIGLFAGELGAFLFCMTTILLFSSNHKNEPLPPDSFLSLLKTAIPISGNRLSLTLFSGFEAFLIPAKLVEHGLSSSQALSQYGILTGMAFSVIFVPSILSNAISVMILPMVSKAYHKKEARKLSFLLRDIILLSFVIGAFCTWFFSVFGHFLGQWLFSCAEAGNYIHNLSFVCPFLFLTSILSSVFHGINQTTTPLVLNLICSLLRILSIWYLVPQFGIQVYLLTLILTNILLASLELMLLKHLL